MTTPIPGDATLVRNFDSLLEVSKALGSVVQVEELLQIIFAKATEVMEAERSSLFVYDETSRSLSVLFSADLGQGQLRIPLGVGIAGVVAETRKPLNIPDAYADARFNPEVDRITGFNTRSILGVPAITSAGRLVGVLQVLNKLDGAPFTPEDESLFLAFASIAGIALDRARLVDELVERQKLDSSLRMAHDIQMGMLPKRFPRRNEFELYAELRPARSVGGDLYDFRLDARHLWFLVGDVSGKGVPAALFMAVSKALFGVSVEVASTPAGVLTRMNRELCRGNEMATFVSAFVGRLHVPSGELMYSNAGHNIPYLLAESGSVTPLAADPGLVMGVKDSFWYRTESTSLSRGDTICVYTDGVSEALAPSGEEYSTARLEARLAAAAGQDAERIVRGTLSTLEEFVGSAPQFDDITLLALRYLGAPEAPPADS